MSEHQAGSLRSRQDELRGRRPLLGLAPFFLLLACTEGRAPPAGGGEPAPGTGAALTARAPIESEWSPQHTEKVRATCSGCHRAPPPEALPRDQWGPLVAKMATMPLPDGILRPSEDDLALALAYYQRRAPERLAAIPPADRAPGPVTFEAEHFTPPGLERERIPAVGNVRFVPLSDPPRLDLLISEMRTGVVMNFTPWAPSRLRIIRPLLRNQNYPVHSRLVDLDLDGTLDVLTAGIGGMNPGNERKGSVIASLQGPRKGFRSHVLSEGLGRPASTTVGDLDGDGDLDVVVPAFGWRGPGGLALLENRPNTEGGLRFISRYLDDRDGYIHAALLDLDGDGGLDIVTVLAQQHESIVAFIHEGGLRFTMHEIYRAPHPGWGYSGLELHDMDGDGDPDLLVSNGDNLDENTLKPYHGVRWFENRGGLRFEPHEVLRLHGCEAATAGDLDGDGDLDVVAVAFLPQISPRVWKERDLDSVVWAEQTPQGWRTRSLEKLRCIHPTVAVGDYDADGKPDIAVGNFVWLRENGTPLLRSDYVTLFTAR